MLNSSLLENITSSVLPEVVVTFTAVSTDTRKIKEGALFVPLKGERFNGHHFIEVAEKSGAVASLWQKDEPIPETLPKSFQLYMVEDTLLALQQMAKAYLERVNPTVIGITGSNGKTTTKDILASILLLHGETYKTQGNYNNHIGLPLTILAMPKTCEYLILEMGMSGFGEIELLSKLASPNEAIVTNIGESHMEQLGSRIGIAKAKMEIVTGLKREGTVFLDGDEPLLQDYIGDSTVKVGFGEQCDVKISNVAATENGYSFSIATLGTFNLSLLGKHNVKNASFCIALANKIGVPIEKIREGVQTVELTEMRLAKRIGNQGELIINDAYNASPSSMIAAIETIKSLPDKQKRIIVLGDMYELGTEEEQLHRQVAEEIEAPITHAVFIGEKAKWIADEWIHNGNQHIQSFISTSKQETARYLQSIIDSSAVVLFKASRGMKLEELIELYQGSRKGE